MTRPSRKTGGERLQGADRVATLLLMMGKPLADRIVSQLDEREIRHLAHAAARLPSVSFDKVGRLIDELAAELGSSEDLVGSTHDAKQLLVGVVAEEEIEEIMAELSGQPPKRIWSRMQDVPDERIVKFLVAERPQVAVFVLSSLPVEKASSVLEKLEAPRRAELSSRLLSVRPISDEAARLVADRLAQEMFGEAEAVSRPDNHARLGAILNQIDRQKAQEILGRLDTSSPDDARRVRRFIFDFEDIVGLSAADLGKVCSESSAEQLVLALRGADAAICEAVLEAVSPRTRRLIEAELSNEVKTAARDIEVARRAISRIVLALAEKGDVSLGQGGAGDSAEGAADA